MTPFSSSRLRLHCWLPGHDLPVFESLRCVRLTHGIIVLAEAGLEHSEEDEECGHHIVLSGSELMESLNHQSNIPLVTRH